MPFPERPQEKRSKALLELRPAGMLDAQKKRISAFSRSYSTFSYWRRATNYRPIQSSVSTASDVEHTTVVARTGRKWAAPRPGWLASSSPNPQCPHPYLALVQFECGTRILRVTHG